MKKKKKEMSEAKKKRINDHNSDESRRHKFFGNPKRGQNFVWAPCRTR